MGRRVIRLTLIIILSTTIIACTSPLRVAISELVKEYSTPVATACFSGITSKSYLFENGAGLSSTSQIIISFTESIVTGSLGIGGNTAIESDGGKWSTTDNANDTLTISPVTVWSGGSGKTLTIDCSDTEEYPIVQISVTFGVLEGIIYVHEEKGSDDNPGTSDLPKAGLHNAVNLAAYLYETADVYVAEGVYQFASPVNITKSISLTGGFSPDDWSIRETDPGWPLTGDLQSAYPTELKSLYTSTGVSGEQPYVIYCSGFEGDVSITGFNIIGGVGESSIAILINQCSPEIRGNYIDGGKGNLSVGIGTSYSSAIIENNKITGGDFEYSTGVYNYLSSITLHNNIISGGGGGTTSSVYNIDSPSVITCNDIYGGDARDSSEAIVAESASDCIIRNNIINAGSASSTTGIRVKSSSPIIQNNIINGGGASSFTDSLAEGLWLYNSSTPVIENNIIFLTSGTTQYAISKGDSNSTPQKVNNNNFYNKTGSGNFVCFIDVDGDLEYPTTDNLNALTFASLNTAADPDIDWDGDLNFTGTSPTAVTEGGLDLSAFFTGDITGATRTPQWSMGAYEKD